MAAYHFELNKFHLLCSLAADGKLDEIKTLISNIPEEDRKRFKVSTFLRSPERNNHVISSGTFSPLHEAAFCGEVEVVKYFVKELSSAVDINHHANVRESTIAQRNIRKGFIPSNVTLVMAACCCGSTEILDFLVGQGVDLHKPTRVWGPPITIASKWGKLNVVEYLIQRGALVNSSFDRRFSSPLLLACGSEVADLETVKYLLRHSACVSHRCLEGYTAMHVAAMCGRLDIIKLLTAHGMHPSFHQGTSKPEDHGYVPCPLYLAASEEHFEVVEYFLSLETCPMVCKGEAHLLLAIMPVLKSSSWIHSFDEGKELWIKGLEIIKSSPVKPAYPPPSSNYLFQTEIASPSELSSRLQVDFNQFFHFDLYIQAFLIAERCLGLSFSSSFDARNNMQSWIGRRAYRFIGLRNEIVQNLWYRSCQAFISRSQIFLQSPNYRGKEYLQLPSNLLPIILAGVRKMVRENYSVNFSFYVRFAIRSLQVLDQLYELANKEYDTKVVFHPKHFLEFFPLWLQSIMNSSKSLDDVHVPKDFVSLGRELFSRFLYQPPGSSLIHQTCFYCYDVSLGQGQNQIFTKLLEYFFSWGEKAVNYCDMEGKRPVHLALEVDDIELRLLLLSSLIAHGAHIDAFDKDGCSALDCNKDSQTKAFLRSHEPLSLKCFVARAIVTEWTFYKNSVPMLPKHIIMFIQLHDANDHHCDT